MPVTLMPSSVMAALMSVTWTSSGAMTRMEPVSARCSAMPASVWNVNGSASASIHEHDSASHEQYLTHMGSPPHRSHLKQNPRSSLKWMRGGSAGQAFMQLWQPMQTSRSMTRAPVSGSMWLAPAGQAATHSAPGHCLQASASLM